MKKNFEQLPNPPQTIEESKEEPAMSVENEASPLDTIEDEIIRWKAEDKKLEKIDTSVVNIQDSKINCESVNDAALDFKNSEFIGNEGSDAMIRVLEGSKLELESLKDSVLRVENSQARIQEVSDSILRIKESSRVIIDEIKDTFITIKSGSDVRIKLATDCWFRVEEGATLNIEENIDSLVKGLGTLTQNKNFENDDSSKLKEVEEKLSAVREQLDKIV